MNDPQGRIVGLGNTLNDAYDFVNKSGQAAGNDLIPHGLQDGMTPKGINRYIGTPPNVNRPEPIPFLQSPLAWTGQKVDNIDQAWKMGRDVGNFTAHWIVPANELIKSVDNRLGTRFHSQVYDPLQLASTTLNAKMDPWVTELSNIEKVSSGMNLNKLQTTMNWLETMSPESRIKNGFYRPINSDEIAMAQHMDDNEAINKGFKYNRFMEQNPNPKPEDLNAFTSGIGMDAKSLEYAKLMEAIKSKSPDVMKLDHVVQLARDINNKSVDRPEFAKANGMTPQHTAVGDMLENMSKRLAPVFGIDPKEIRNNWMTHARLYSDGDIQGAINQFSRKDNPTANPFYGAQARTGEIDAYERNPLIAMYRYIKAGFKAKYYSPIEANANQYLEQTLSQQDPIQIPGQPKTTAIVPSAEQGKVRAIITGYINDNHGRVPAMSKATESAWKNYVDKVAPGLPESARDIVINLNKSVQIGTQGFKVGAGTRDFMVTSGMINYKYGPERLVSVLTKGATEVANGNKLIKSGEISGLSLDKLNNPTEDENSIPSKILGGAKDAYARFGELALKGSGQTQAYNLARQGLYMDTFSRVAKAARTLGSSATDAMKEAFYKEIYLDKDFAPSIGNEIRKQVNDSPIRSDEIAKYLARESVRQGTPTYGLGNNPHGWGRNIGKFLGQYGSYPAWALQALTEPMTTGTIGERLLKAGRFAAWTGAIYEAGQATGLNFSPWYIHRTGFSGSPLGQLGLNIFNTVGASGYEQKNAADQLSRLMPINSNGDLNLRQFYIPASFAIGDYLDATVGGNTTSAIGIRPGKESSIVSTIMDKINP